MALRQAKKLQVGSKVSLTIENVDTPKTDPSLDPNTVRVWFTDGGNAVLASNAMILVTARP